VAKNRDDGVSDGTASGWGDLLNLIVRVHPNQVLGYSSWQFYGLAAITDQFRGFEVVYILKNHIQYLDHEGCEFLPTHGGKHGCFILVLMLASVTKVGGIKIDPS
jgi:hypothetical protein